VSESSLRDWLRSVRPEIDGAIDRLLPQGGRRPERLHAAVRAAATGGGKRLRPGLVVLVGELFGAPRVGLLDGAVAVELIHTYSLVHDDLPALDDDDLRRGRPTLHRAYDEATAILAGDALLTLGLTLLAERPESIDAGLRARAAALVGRAIGSEGMIGGQVEDLEAEAAWPDDPQAALERIHLGKTAALLTAALRLGGLYAGVPTDVDRTLGELGRDLGLLFQVRDDLLDVAGTTSELGKTAGKDARAGKLTYPALFGMEEARRRLERLAERARERAAALPADARLLISLVDYLAERTS